MDAMLIIREMCRLFKSDCIIPTDLEEAEFDSPLGIGATGGSHPIYDGKELAAQRGNHLWKLDAKAEIRFFHENPDVRMRYKEFLRKPLGERSYHLFHTTITPGMCKQI